MALGLNIVVGFAGLLDLGYVAFYAIGAFVVGWLGLAAVRRRRRGQRDPHPDAVAERVRQRHPRHPHQLLLRDLHRRGVHGALGGHPRRADAAVARRLPGDRDARLRRDRPARVRERHERHLRDRLDGLLQRPPGDHAGRQDQLPVDGRALRLSARAEARLLRRPGDAAVRHLLQHPPARLAARAGVDRRARGRGGGRGDGRQPRAHEAVGLRDRRRRSAASPASSSAPTTTPSTSTSSSSASRCSSSAWSSSAAWATSGA